MSVNRQYILAELPTGKLGGEHFRLQQSAIPSAAEGEVLLRVRYISLDAASRARMRGATYRPAVTAGTVMPGGVLGEVIASKAEGFAVGDLVSADGGWQDYVALPAKSLTKLAKLEPATHLLSVYGIAGLTAYFGLLDIGRLQSGETVVISAAAGAVGSIVGQIAKLKGCRVVGITGGAEKGAWLTRELGFDAAVDYKRGDVSEALKAAAPDGIDVYFDNVGGDVLEACLPQMNLRGRIVCCGGVSYYDGTSTPPGPRGVPGLVVVKRLTLQGFVFTDFDAERERALQDLRAWVEAGKLRVHEDIVDGLEHTPAALIGLLAGDNRGKRLVKVA